MRINQLPKNPDDDCQFFALQRPAPRLPRHDADAPPAGPADVQGGDPSAGHDVPAQRPAGGDAVLAQRRRRPRLRQGLAPGLRRRRPTATTRSASAMRAARAARCHAYRLTIRPPRPSFNVSFSPTAPAVSKGSASADHRDGRPHRRLRRPDRRAPGEPAARLQRPGDHDPGRRNQHELRPVRRADGRRAARRRRR